MPDSTAELVVPSWLAHNVNDAVLIVSKPTHKMTGRRELKLGRLKLSGSVPPNPF